MKRNQIVSILTAIFIFLGFGVVFAEPVIWSGNGHYYDVVEDAAYSGEIGHAFQSKPAGDSSGKRPLIPVKSATLSERSDARVFTFTFLSLMVSRN